ncbi:hypothetical protein BS47DRAFT_1376650 [Hydnum rufescens UP504]|uniref:GOLD domain-containing protein n=1 Tax=Hydnum rufescens UP504 TaxID=1448309 RepID=A0A9P6AZW2_9AGAM|nr:hypothetical protein BS47DRAFT_1376650 [Hydnum rufescens UP504]
MVSLLCLFTLLSYPTPSYAIKFDLPSSLHPIPKCIWNAAHKNALIVVTANVGPGKGQRVDKDIKGETRLAVTAHADGDVGVCFTNSMDLSEALHKSGANYLRVIDLDVDIGADAIDYNAIASQDGLSAMEVEMKKLEGIVKEIVDELGYLKDRETRFQITNASTNERVQKFGLLTLVTLIALGVWQIFHLRAFFRRKYLID